MDVRAGYQKCQIGRHVLYLRTADTGAIVEVRTLHERMDVSRKL